MAIDRSKISKLAENHMAMGRVDRAIEEFLKLIEDRSDDYNLLNRVGDAYLQAGKTPEAVDLFRKAGSGFERGGFNAKATAVFKKAHRVAADDVDISERLAELYRQTNMIKEAIQIHIEVAEICTKKGLLKRALEEFAKVVDLDPKNLKNKVKLADLYNKEGMKDRAANIYLDVAEALALEQMHSEANQILERAKTMVTTPQVFLTQSRLCVIQKDLAAAAQHLREGLEANPRSPELLDALAEVELQSKRPEQALEALAQVPQLPEKSLQLCERAVRELVRAGKVDAALALFKPIGREFARRGLGEAAAKALQSGLQGSVTAEAWLQLAEIAHQGGNRGEEVECLRHAFAEAVAAQDPAMADPISQRLQALGVKVEDLSAPFAQSAAQPQAEELDSPLASLATEATVIRRMQIQKLQRDAEHFLQQRYLDSALESFGRVLELDPANQEAIFAIAEIHRSTGMLTKIQMHFVKTAERIAPLGFKVLAVQLLDRAETMFPGSTRLYRRTLGLMDVVMPAGPTVPETVPAPGPMAELPLIPLDLEVREWSRDRSLPIPLPAATVAPPPESGPAPGTATTGQAVPGQAAPGQAAPGQAAPEYEWAEFSDVLGLQAQLPPAAEVPETEAAPVWEILDEQATAAWELPAEPAAVAEALPEAAPAAPAPVPDELAAILSDVDFQMDYGSPEEAKIVIEAALDSFPEHPELLARQALAEQALRRMGHAARAEQQDTFAPSFFDLTDVLGDALLEGGDGEEMHDATNVVEKIQSIDELFNAFREGVEQQVKGDDYDTHYNLGIAYKEMMLLEPAIEEFKSAMRDPERTLECCSMLAICEQAQGNLEAASQWLRQGIEAPGFPPEDGIGLRFDLGTLLLAMDRPEEAREQFQLVFDQDPDYGGVAKYL